MSWRCRAGLASGVLILFMGCATSEGSLYREPASGRQEQAPSLTDSTPKPQPLQPVERGLEIDTDPDGAAVYLDNRYAGETPLLLEGLAPGRYQLRLELQGYYPQDSWIDYAGGHMVFRADLLRVTGFLQVDVQPPQAAVTVGERALSPGVVHELPAGTHTARIRLFGFEDYSAQVRVERGNLTRLQVELQSSALRLEDLRSSRTALNPENPGLLGRARLRFRVSSYGSGSASVLDASGREVWRRQLERFTTWEQSFDWDGVGSGGARLPDGAYTLRVQVLPEGGAPEDGGQAISAEIPVRLDSSLRLAYRPVWNAVSGLLFVPSPEVLPGRGIQASTLVATHVSPPENDAFHTPWDLGLRVGLATRPGMELDFHGGLMLGYGQEVPWFASGAAKLSLSRGWLASSGLVRLSYQAMRTDSFAGFTGLGLGVPLSASAGLWSFFLGPELVLSLWEVSYEPADQPPAPWPTPSFTAWSYLKAGIALDLDSVTLGLSAAARSLPFRRGLGVDLPVLTGLEAHWMIPGTQAFLTAMLTGEFGEHGSFALNAGAGVGLLN